MKDWLREYSLTVGIFAAVALLASLIAGVAAGNPFGVVVFRALLAAILFGGFGAGARYLVRRFLLPETAAAEPPPAPTIDIVLPEERPFASPEAASEAASAAVPVEELESPGDEAPDGAASGPSAEEATAVDELPEISALEPEEEPEAPGVASLGTLPPPAGVSARTADAARDRLSGEDPSTLARALRTVLKREER